MLLSRSCVAESLSTTPRAPNCRASTIWLFSAAAVSRITRTGLALAGVLKSRSASRPGCFGIARSSNRMSGFSWRANFTASAPSEASPSTLKSDSASSNRRNPSRKIGWSSAITRRTCCDFLKCMRYFPIPRHTDFQTRSLSGSRFYREFAGNQTYPLFYDLGPFAIFFQLLVIVAASKLETAAVVFHGQVPLFAIGAQPHQSMSRSAVLSYADQSFLHDAQDFPAHPLRHVQLFKIGDEPRGDASLSLKTFHRVAQYAQQSVGVDVNRLHLLHQFAQLQHFFAQQALDPPQLAADRHIRLGLPAYDVHLHLHRD